MEAKKFGKIDKVGDCTIAYTLYYRLYTTLSLIHHAITYTHVSVGVAEGNG